MPNLTNAQRQQRWRNKNRRDWFAGKCCVECGSINELQADHIDPSTKDWRLINRNSSDRDVWAWPRERREAELANCQALCKPCHLKKTQAEYATKRTHGKTMYNHGCRCEICREASARAHNYWKPRT